MAFDRAKSKPTIDRAQREDRRREERDNQKQALLASLVFQQVMQALGELPNLFRLQVRPLWEGRFRANVYVGPDALSSRIVHSFFIITDDEGRIVESRPLFTSIRSMDA
jgi:hypothetical protein